MKAADAERAGYLLAVRKMIWEEVEPNPEKPLGEGEIGLVAKMDPATRFELKLGTDSGELYTIVEDLSPKLLFLGLLAMLNAIDAELRTLGIEIE